MPSRFKDNVIFSDACVISKDLGYFIKPYCLESCKTVLSHAPPQCWYSYRTLQSNWYFIF